LELDQVDENRHLLDSLAGSIEKVRNKIAELQAYLKRNPFKQEASEIQYFKVIYPKFCSELIFFSASYNLEKELKLIDNSEWTGFLNEELKEVQRFFRKNRILYEYYRLDLSELDSIYFTSKGSARSHLFPEFPALDFTAAAISSYTFSKIKAYERLSEQIRLKLIQLESPVSTQLHHTDPKLKLKWTGDAINLVELAYGIWLTGQFNNGNSTITEIVRWLEDRLQINIGRAYRRWTEISQRKFLSRTKYLDQMKNAIEKRIDEENAIKRQQRRI
jgi:hypothetical protein